MKKIVLKLYEFDELSKDSQERIIEREHWNVMDTTGIVTSIKSKDVVEFYVENPFVKIKDE